MPWGTGDPVGPDAADTDLEGPAMDRRKVPVTARWGEIVGYSRAIRAGDLVFVSGTTASDRDGNALHPGDVGRQAEHVFATILAVLETLGARAEHVVETRIFLTDGGNWETVGRAHAKFFGHVRPAVTMVEVGPFVSPDMLVKVAVTASLAAD